MLVFPPSLTNISPKQPHKEPLDDENGCGAGCSFSLDAIFPPLGSNLMMNELTYSFQTNLPAPALAPIQPWLRIQLYVCIPCKRMCRLFLWPLGNPSRWGATGWFPQEGAYQSAWGASPTPPQEGHCTVFDIYKSNMMDLWKGSFTVKASTGPDDPGDQLLGPLSSSSSSSSASQKRKRRRKRGRKWLKCNFIERSPSSVF